MTTPAPHTSTDTSLDRRARRRRLAALLIAALVAAAISGLALERAGSATAADPSPVAITEAPPLDWAFKASWADYAEAPRVGKGATVVPTPGAPATYTVAWPFVSGTYDEGSRTTTLAWEGSAQWQSHYSEADGYYLLDVTVSDPRLTISGGESTFSVEIVSREFKGPEPGKLVDYGRVPFESLDVSGVTPTVEGGKTSWNAIPAYLTAEGAPAFAGFYQPGLQVDPISFSYSGPGGAPDLDERFDEEGQVRVKLDQNVVYHRSENVETDQSLWVDQDDLIANSTREFFNPDSKAEEVELGAFDLGRMEAVGDPLVLPAGEAPTARNVVAYDTSRDRVLYHAEGEEGITRWLRFDPASGRYETGRIADPRMGEAAFVGGESQGLAWNEPLDLGWRIDRDEATGEWQLVTYKEGADGKWARSAYAIPEPVEAGESQGPARAFEPFARYFRNYATASDGSMIVLENEEFTAPDPDAPETIPAALRLTLREGSVAVEPLPLRVSRDGNPFWQVKTTANGRIVMVAPGTGEVAQCQIGGDDTVGCEPPVSLRGSGEPSIVFADYLATDPADGTSWYGGFVVRRLAAVGDGRYLGSQLLQEMNPRGAPVVVGADHTVYIQSNDGSPREDGGSRTWGWAKLTPTGFTPTVGTQPKPQAVSLTASEGSKSVAFTAAATAEPAATIRWQRKAPGSSRFVDLAGETDGTLTVKAERGMDGTEYRAVFENAAGKVASAPATLSVDYAPRVTLDLANVKATEGEPAEFAVLAEGNPAPQITWERRVDGFWQPISAADDNFLIDGPALTVLETNTEQSGSLFRAKLVNSAGSATTRAATLTVTPAAQIPPGGIAVSRAQLDWLGDEVMQKAPPFGGSNYFSAGVSAGTEATYRSVDGDAAILQVAAGGGEAPATYATRAAHVSGGRQVARLYGGEGRVEADGSADIRWDAAFSVNFYGGLVPFTISDPELRVGADGTGTLTATLSGCAASRNEPNVCAPLTPAANVVVADFSGARIEPGKPLTVQPIYSGVAVDVPANSGAAPQVRSGPSWGAWPQSFVDFQLQTGLASYWYSSGSDDEAKPPLPFTVDFEGPAGPASEPPTEVAPPASTPPAGSGDAPAPQPGDSTQPVEEPKAKHGRPAKIRLRKAVRLDRRGPTTVATLACPKGGAACTAIVPARLATRIDGRRYLVVVDSPRKIAPGRSAAVTVALPKAAREALGDRGLTVRLRIVVRSGGHATTRILRVRIAATGAR